MSFSASALMSAQRPTSLLKKHLIMGCLLLLSCFGIQPVLAAGECSLSAISAQTQYGQGGATLVYSFTLTDNGGCNAESGAVKIISDSTQSATVNKTVWSTGVSKPTSISVKLGGNIGGQVLVTVSCKNCAAPTSLTFTGVVTGDYLFVAKPLSSINSTVAADTVLPLVVSLTKTGSPVPGELVIWKQLSGPSTASIAPVTGKFTDGNGENQINFKAGITGIYKVRASVCDPADTRFCTELLVDFTIDVGGTPGSLQFNRVSPASPVSASPGDKVTLTAEYLFKSSGYIGQDVVWSISPLGGASLGTNITPVTDSSGRVSNVVNIDSSGSYTVTAKAKCDGSEPGCQPADIIWLINVGTAKLEILGGDGQTGAINTIASGLTVSATTGGSGDGGLTINWSVVSGDALINSTSGPTDTGGKAAADVLFGNTPGTVIVKAERSDNPGIRVFFTLASGIRQLDNLSGTPTVAAGQSISLIAFANLGGVAITDGRVNWTNNNPGATNIGVTSVLVDLTGRASTTFTANQGGLFTVTACYNALGNATCVGSDPTTTFTIDAIALKKTAGDAQSITVGNLSSALAVQLESGTAPNPLSIEWTVSGPATLTTPTTPLDGSGNSNNTVTATGPGAIVVTASWISSLRAFPTQSVVFNLNAIAAPPVLSPVSSNPLIATVGTPFNAVVRLTDSSSIPIAGASIKFSSSTGVNSTPTIVTTDSGGRADSGAIFTAQVAGLLNNVVIAEYDPTPVSPSSGDEVIFRFNVNASAPPVVRTLLNHDGDGQSTPAGLAFPLNVVVQALDNGLSAPDGTQIQYSIDASSTATGAVLSCCGTTSGSFSGVGVTAGTTQGNLVVRAQRVDDATAFVLFNLTVAPPVLQSIVVTPATPTIAYNGAQTFVATGSFSDTSTADISATVTWTSSNTSLATMTGATANGAGSFTGGATTITATQGVISGTATLNVTAAPVVLVSIAVTPATPSITFNGSQTFVATGTYNDSSTVDISASVVWTSSNTTLATMTGATANAAGSFTGGATTITATQGAINGTATLNVTATPVVLVSIAVTPATTTIASNGSQTFVATGTYNNASTANISASVTWTSSNTTLATMTGATANGAGSFTGGATTITVTQGAINGTATLNVTATPVVLVSIAVTPATTTIASNGSQTFVATGTYNNASTANISASVTWTSSNTTLATMTGATANGAGSFTGGATTITATQGAISGTATLNVNPAAVVLVSIAVSPATATIASNGSQTYIATGTFNDASTGNISASVVWSSSNTSLASMTGATANGAGSFTGGATTITATQGAISGTATLNVNPAAVVLVSIAVTPATATIASNGSQTYVATGTFNDASTANISASVVWTSSNTTLATMTGATANGAGSFSGGATTITATQGAISGTATLNVNAAAVVLVSIAVTPATSTIASNGSQIYIATGTFNDASTANISASVVWSSSNNSLATMAGATANGAGSFTGGATTITATQGAINGTATLNVTAAPAVKTIAIISGNGQTVIAGNAFTTMSVSAQDNGVPVSGLSISWTVSGAGSATPAITSSVTDSGGIAIINMTSVNPGLITVTAARSDDLTKFVAFNHTINAIPASTLTKQSGDNQQGVLGSFINNPLVVRLQDGFGAALSGQTISWSVLSGPATLSGTSSVTNASGDGQISLTFGNTSGAATIRASALGGSLTQNFTASAVTVTLGSASGNGQSAPVSTVLPLPLTVQITPPTGVTSIGPKSGSIKALSGVPVTFAITTGTGALLSVTNTVTNAGGSASTTLTLGPSAGAYVVTASTPGGSTTSFTATATALAVGDSITKLNGDSQSLTPGNASVLMRVRLLNIANNPVFGAIIQWTALNGTLTSATSTTNAAGEATNIVTAISSGVVTVKASYTDPASSLVTGPVTFSHNAGISNLSGLTTEQASIADAIDTLCPALAATTSPTPAQTALLNDCTAIINAVGVDPAAATNALDQLIPNIAIAQATATMLAAQSQFQNLKARIAALRSGTQGTSFEGLAYTNGSGTISLGELGNALTGDDQPSPPLGADFQRWGFFAAGTIGRGEAQAGNVNPAFDYDINGLTAGLDYRYSDKFIFGAAVGITRQGSDLNGSEGTLDTTGWSASAYSTFYKENSWYADSVLTYGRNTYDLERRIRYTLPLPGGGFTTIDQTGRSSSSGDMLEAAFTFGHDFQKGGLSIGPYGRLLYTKLGFDQSVETLEAGPGSGLGVVIETRDLTSIASQVGAKFTYSHSTDWGVVIPHVQVEWEHEFKDDPAQITTRFLNDPTATPIVITGDPQDTDYFRIGLGLSMILSKGRSGFFYYEQVLGRDGYSQYNLGLGLRIEF